MNVMHPHCRLCVFYVRVCCAVLVVNNSWTPTRMTSTLAGLISRLYSPPAVIELLITLSVNFAFHRWTSVYVPRRWAPTLDKDAGERGGKERTIFFVCLKLKDR